jgi:hypothetical protein
MPPARATGSSKLHRSPPATKVLHASLQPDATRAQYESFLGRRAPAEAGRGALEIGRTISPETLTSTSSNNGQGIQIINTTFY